MEWLENGKSQHRSEFDGDLIINFEKHADVTRVQFRFRKNSIYKIISNNEYVVVARDGNNIYFKESNATRGFKVSRWTDNVKIFKVSCEKLKLTEDNIGEYNIEFDSNLGLHYICLGRKLEKTLYWEGK